MSANSFISNIFLVAASDAARFGNCSMLELDSPIKRQLMKIQENADTL